MYPPHFYVSLQRLSLILPVFLPLVVDASTSLSPSPPALFVTPPPVFPLLILIYISLSYHCECELVRFLFLTFHVQRFSTSYVFFFSAILLFFISLLFCPPPPPFYCRTLSFRPAALLHYPSLTTDRLLTGRVVRPLTTMDLQLPAY